ncbi:class GN sortase [Euryhalocaulis caribicus]|uniref:class GN sortase n=1 Tax=Euryhalocaulis caribicus TaxID=1161401 RepID=UPI00068764B9|nr:class GN sortase [Euryhalocaulis caribicus]
MAGTGSVRLTRIAPFALAAALAAAGAALFGQGLYLSAKAEVAQLLLNRAWDRSVQSHTAAKPWPWADTWPVARLSAPRLKQSAVVLAEAGGEAMAFGPAHLSQTPQPGTPGVSVIAAHRDSHFAFLKDLKTGDTLVLETGDGQKAFKVTGFEVVDHQASGIHPDGGPPRLALVTCYPFGAMQPGPLRYIVWAEPEPEPARTARPAARRKAS